MQVSPGVKSLYSPLPKDTPHFRLLRRIPNQSKTTSCFELKEFSLTEDRPQYHALSYTWGCPFPNDHPLADDVDWETAGNVIEVNGRSFSIRQNLADVLNEFHDLPHGDKWTWIDAICINQSNLEERSSQVSHMRRILCGCGVCSCLAWSG